MSTSVYLSKLDRENVWVLAMLVFSLIAGFDLNSYIKCDEGSNLPNTSYRLAYPYSSYHNATGGISIPFRDGRATSGAQFAVTWGVFTCFYCLAALAVYVVFTDNENMEKLVDTLVYVGLGCHFVWVVGWFIVSVEWVVSLISISYTFSDHLLKLATEVGYLCRITQDTKVQADIASAFLGFFDVNFVEVCHPVYMSTGPESDSTHWKQTTFYLDQSFTVHDGDAVSGEISVRKNTTNPRGLVVDIEYEVNSVHKDTHGHKGKQTFFMD